MWAAYRLGAFSRAIDRDLSKQEFTEVFLQLMGIWDHEWVLHAPNDQSPDGEIIPVGIMIGYGKDKIIEPHVEWFPWASDRNKLEGMLAFFSEVSKEYKLFAYILPENQNFFVRLCRYGVLTSGCKILDYFGKGEHVYFFYTRGP